MSPLLSLLKSAVSNLSDLLHVEVQLLKLNPEERFQSMKAHADVLNPVRD